MTGGINSKIPKIFVIMVKLSKKNIFGSPKKNYFKTMAELYSVIGGINGGTQPIISFLKELNIIGKDKNGYYYDTFIARKYLKESIFSELGRNHDLADVFG